MTAPWIITTILIVVALIVLAGVATYAPALVVRRRQRSTLRDLCRGKLALTYDDGPGKRLTPRLLDLLKSYNAQATFFMVGFRMDDAPELVQRTLDDGHEIGSHGYWHKNAWRVNPLRAVKDVIDGLMATRQWREHGTPYRAPFGRLTTWTWLAARVNHATLCWWTCDARDQMPKLPDPETIVQQVIDRGGAVVLMHSHDSGEHRERYVLELTEQLLVAARDNGLKICTMSKVLPAGDGKQVEAA